MENFDDIVKLTGILTYSDVSPLHLAAEHGHFSIVKRIIENISDKFPLDGSGRTPLHHAIVGGNLKVFKLLHSYCKEINPYAFTRTKVTLLHIAVIKEKFEIITFIMKKLPLPQRNPPDRNGKTPLALAINKENVQLVELIKSFLELPFDDEPLSVCTL